MKDPKKDKGNKEDKDLKEKYKDALEVIKQLDKLPMQSYHIEKFKEKWRGEV